MGDRKRRFWSAEEKRSICLQASAPGISVAQVALRYSMNANLIFKWLRDPRFASGDAVGPEPSFLPVEIRPATMIEAPVAPTAVTAATSRLQIDLADGHRIVAEGGFDVDALGRLLKGWLA